MDSRHGATRKAKRSKNWKKPNLMHDRMCGSTLGVGLISIWAV